MGETAKTGNHRLEINNRNSIKMTGIKKVISFEPEQVLLITDLGKLKITGKDMQVNNLDIDKGLLDVNGDVDCLCYMTDKNGGQFSWKRMFK